MALFVPLEPRYVSRHNQSPEEQVIHRPPIETGYVSTPRQSREEQLVATIRKAIHTDDVIAFKSGLQEVFKKDWELLKGCVLHRISLQGNNTVLHETAMVKGALSILKTICRHAPFLMGKTNLAGETVWHIAARQNHSTGVFEMLYHTRQFWKIKLEAADTPTLPVNGVFGGKADLSIRAANISHGNTALHEALLIKNTLVAKKLFYADKELCYMINGENKSPMQLALEIGDAELFTSMFKYAASTPRGMSAINVQKIMLLQVAFGRGHEDSVINLIQNASTSREEITRPIKREVGSTLHHNQQRVLASAATDNVVTKSSIKSKPTAITYRELIKQKPVPIPEKPVPFTEEPVVNLNNLAAAQTDHQVDPIKEVRLAITYAILHYAKSFSSFKTVFVSSLVEGAAERVKDMKALIQPGYQHSDPKVMIDQLLFISIYIFFLTLPFTYTTRPKFRPFFAINKLLWFIVCYGTLALAFSRHSGNMLGLTSRVLGLYLKLVKLMMVLEFIAAICFLAYKYDLYTIGVTFAEWSYNYLL